MCTCWSNSRTKGSSNAARGLGSTTRQARSTSACKRAGDSGRWRASTTWSEARSSSNTSGNTFAATGQALDLTPANITTIAGPKVVPSLREGQQLGPTAFRSKNLRNSVRRRQISCPLFRANRNQSKRRPILRAAASALSAESAVEWLSVKGDSYAPPYGRSASLQKRSTRYGRRGNCQC